MPTHLTDEQMILYYYGEPCDDSSIREHLDSCGPCRSEYQNLQRSLALVTADSIPERSADYGSRLWRQLQSGLHARGSSSDVRRWTLDLGRWTPLAWGGVVAALLVGAFLLGRHWPNPQPPAALEQATALSPQAREQVLLSAIADHLEESQLVLMEIAHAPESEKVDIAASQSMALEALKANRICRQAAVRNGEQGLASVLDDLEPILLDIVHSPSTVSSAQIDEIRQRIQAQEILFKLRVLGSTMRERQKDAARELSRRSS